MPPAVRPRSCPKPPLAPFVAAAAVAMVSAAVAHHPGSHADRRPDGRVRIDAAAQATDACTRIAGIAAGLPPGISPPPAATPVTARLERAGTGPCAAVVTGLKAEAVLDLPRDARTIFLYIVAPDGTVAATERVPIR